MSHDNQPSSPQNSHNQKRGKRPPVPARPKQRSMFPEYTDSQQTHHTQQQLSTENNNPNSNSSTSSNSNLNPNPSTNPTTNSITNSTSKNSTTPAVASPTPSSPEFPIHNAVEPKTPEQTQAEQAEHYAIKDIIDFEKPICKLAQTIDWQEITNVFGEIYKHQKQQYNVRQLVALFFLKKQTLLSDQSLLTMWLENPYWQYFSGEQEFQTAYPFPAKTLKAFQQSIGKTGEDFLIGLAEKYHLLVNPLTTDPLFVKPKSIKFFRSKKAEKPREITIPQPIKWYQDYLFYVFLLAAVIFWTLFSFVFPTGWPNKPLTFEQWKIFGSIVLVYPILEEVVFRYGIQSGLYFYRFGRIQAYGISTANLLTSLTFWLSHILIRPNDILVYGIIIPSLIFGFFRDRHGHIYASIILHIFYNLGIFLLLILPHL